MLYRKNVGGLEREKSYKSTMCRRQFVDYNQVEDNKDDNPMTFSMTQYDGKL